MCWEATATASCIVLICKTYCVFTLIEISRNRNFHQVDKSD